MEALPETSKGWISWKPSLSWIPWLVWGTLELLAIWKHWPFNKSKQTLPLTIKDADTIEDKMEAQKRKFETMLAEKDARIDDSDNKLKITEEQKDNDIKQLKMENQNLDSKRKQTEKILRDTKKKLDDAEANTQQRDDQIKHLQMEKGKLDSTLKQTERDKTILNNELLTVRKQLNDTEEKLFEVRKLKREAEAEKHDALRRLSEMVSVKLRDNNPNIVDLNDEYRPTKLAEMFSELYDNEWTAAYTVMEDNEFQDRQMIDFLLDVVMESYIFCKDEVEKSWNVVSTWFLDDDLPKVQQMRKALKDGRKAIAWKLIPDIEKKYTSYIESVCRHEPLKKLLSIEDIRKYMALCLKLTLLMNANDPPVYLECSGWKPIRDREEEDKDLQESENSGDEFPNNGEQPNSQDDKDEDSSNVDEKEMAETTETDSSSQDITPDDMDQDEEQKIEKQPEGKSNENPSSTESKERFEKKDGTESNENLETGSCQQGDAPTGNDDSGQDSINKDKENKDNAQDIATEKDLSQIKESNDELSPSTNAGVNEDAGEEMVVNNGHDNAESSSLNKLVEDPMDQGNSQNAGFSDERRINEIDHECKNNENPSSTESKERFEKKDETECNENVETGSCQQGDAPTGNDDSGQDSINKDKENKDNAQDIATEKDLSHIKESNDELSPSTNAGVNEDAGEEMVVNNGHGNAEPSSLNKLVEDPMDQGNSPNTGFSDERRNNEIDHECKNNENPNSAETTKPSENKERTDSNANKQPENGERGETVADAVADNGDSGPVASSPTNDENGTTRLEEEKDKLKTNSPSSGCENDNDDSSKICGRELRNEVTVAATRGEFEKDKYKEYTTRGKYTEFHVWPIMYLHKGGPMLGKGIAQGVKDSKAEPSDKPWAWWK